MGICQMAEPLTTVQAKARLSKIAAEELTALTPESVWEWTLLAALTGFIAGSLPEDGGARVRDRIDPLLTLLIAAKQNPATREPAPDKS
jgi:hypothetical protein